MNVLLVWTILAAAFFLALAAFQFALAAGVPWGAAAYGGASPVLPLRLRLTSGMAVIIWGVSMLLVIQRYRGEGLAFLNANNVAFMLWIVVAYLMVGVLMNAISPSELERKLWTPASLVGLISTASLNILA